MADTLSTALAERRKKLKELDQNIRTEAPAVPAGFIGYEKLLGGAQQAVAPKSSLAEELLAKAQKDREEAAALQQRSAAQRQQPMQQPQAQGQGGLSPALQAKMAEVRKDAALQKSIASKVRYVDEAGALTVKGMIPLHKLGMQGEQGRAALGINPNDLTDDEMEYLMRQHQAQAGGAG